MVYNASENRSNMKTNVRTNIDDIHDFCALSIKFRNDQMFECNSDNRFSKKNDKYS